MEDETTEIGGLDQGRIDSAVDALLGNGIADSANPTPAPVVTPPAVEAKKEPEVEAPKIDKLEELVKREEARRVTDLQRQRDEYAGRLKALEAKAEQKPTPKELSFGEVRRMAGESPDDLAKRTGFRDAAHMAKYLWNKKLGQDGDTGEDDAFLGLRSQVEEQASELRRLQDAERQRVEDGETQRREELTKQTLLAEAEAHLEAMPHVKVFLGAQRVQTANTLRALSDELGKSNPGVTPTMVAIELERRLAALRPTRISELKAELALWEPDAAQIETPKKQGQTAPAKPPTNPKTLTSSDGAVGKDPPTSPATEEERIADTVRWLKEQNAREVSP